MRFRACDTVIFLDYGFDVCMDGIVRRVGTERPDIPWTEQTVDPDLVRQVEAYENENCPAVLSLMEKYPEKQSIVFRSRAEADAWLEKL